MDSYEVKANFWIDGEKYGDGLKLIFSGYLPFSPAVGSDVVLNGISLTVSKSCLVLKTGVVDIVVEGRDRRNIFPEVEDVFAPENVSEKKIAW